MSQSTETKLDLPFDIATIVHEWAELRDADEWLQFSRFYGRARASGLVAFLAGTQEDQWLTAKVYDRFRDFFTDPDVQRLRSNPPQFNRWCHLMHQTSLLECQ